MTSHIQKLRALGERMVGNLNAMGVSASFNDGAITLADKILEIPGLVLDTNISWYASSTSISVGESVTFTGKVFAYANLEDNQGFCGFLRGVPVKIYNGATLLDTVTSDSNGEFTYTYTSSASGTLSMKSLIVAGTNFDGCESAVITVSVDSWDGMSLVKSAGYDILSYADEQQTPNSQYCTVTAQLLNGQSPVGQSGIPVVFGVYKDDVLVDTETTVDTDSNGQASFTYRSQGLGNVVVKAVPDNRTLLTKTYDICDAWKYDTTVYESNSASYVVEELNYSMPSNCSITYEAYSNGSNGMAYSIIGADLSSRVTYGKIGGGQSNQIMLHENNSQKSSQFTPNTMPNNTWYTQTLTIENNVVTYENKTVSSSIINLSNLYRLYLNNGKIKNILIKPL